MIDDLLGGLKENVKKSRNPFFGTFIITWSVRHWDLYYSIFTFDSGTKLAERKKYINNYFDYHHFYKELICCAFLAVGILIVSYIFMALTRFVKKIYLQNVIPWVNTRFRSKEIKTIGEYNSLMTKYNDILIKNEELENKNAELNVIYKGEVEAHLSTVDNFDGAATKKDFFGKLLDQWSLRDVLDLIYRTSRSNVGYMRLNDKLKSYQSEVGFLLIMELIENYQHTEDLKSFKITDLGREFILDI